jgi:hypothetical protein
MLVVAALLGALGVAAAVSHRVTSPTPLSALSMPDTL